MMTLVRAFLGSAQRQILTAPPREEPSPPTAPPAQRVVPDTAWRTCAHQLAEALEELIDSYYLGDAANSVKANLRSLAHFRQLQLEEEV